MHQSHSGLGGLEGLVFLCCSSTNPLPPGLHVWPSWRRAHASDSMSGQRPRCLHLWHCSQVCSAGQGAGQGQDPGEAGLKARPSQTGYWGWVPGAALGAVVSILPAVLSAHHPAAVSQLPNEAGLWLLGQLISRGLFVLHTLMLFNSKILIKWKVLLEAREQPQQDSA